MSDNAKEQAQRCYERIKELVDRYDAPETANEDTSDVEQEMDEMPLSVEVRCAGWSAPGEPLYPDEFQILLVWGGPAVRIVGNLDEYGEPINPRIEYQDWGTPWIPLPVNDDERTSLAAVKHRDAVLTRFCGHFYFGG